MLSLFSACGPKLTSTDHRMSANGMVRPCSRPRRMLATTRTVIVDEIHAVAPNKRGSHLALSLERLTSICAVPPQRIGLSATQKPVEDIARFLVGAGRPGEGALDCALGDSG